MYCAFHKPIYGNAMVDISVYKTSLNCSNVSLWLGSLFKLGDVMYSLFGRVIRNIPVAGNSIAPLSKNDDQFVAWVLIIEQNG